MRLPLLPLGARPSCNRAVLSENSSFCSRSAVFQCDSLVMAMRSPSALASDTVSPGLYEDDTPSWNANQPAMPESRRPCAAAMARSSLGWPCA